MGTMGAPARIAVSTTGDPTGSYFRYAFTTGFNFPDYPKYSVFRDTYVITTREFGVADPSIYGIGVYGLERAKMIAGDPNARAVSFLLDSNRIPINLIGDGLLPADVDGRKQPRAGAAIPLVGTQDDGGPYGATSDALNIWEFSVNWNNAPAASIGLKAQLPVAPFDSVFPCTPTARDCLPQPGITDRIPERAVRGTNEPERGVSPCVASDSLVHSFLDDPQKLGL